MKKNCKICDKVFEIPKTFGGYNKLTCSDRCSKLNTNRLKRESKLRLKEEKNKILNDYSNLWRIPVYQVVKYGVDFLKENPDVIEVIQLQTKLSGRFTFLTEEEIEIRRKAVVRERNKRHREKRGYKKKSCIICSKEFIPGIDVKSNVAVCCSVECSKERARIQNNESCARYRRKKGINKRENIWDLKN